MSIATLGDVETLERVPFAERQPASSVYDMLCAVADRFPDKPAFRSLDKGLADEPTRDMSYGQLKQQITQAANLFRALGVGGTNSVSLLMPIAPKPSSRCSARKRPEWRTRSISCWSRSKSSPC